MEIKNQNIHADRNVSSALKILQEEGNIALLDLKLDAAPGILLSTARLLNRSIRVADAMSYASLLCMQDELIILSWALGIQRERGQLGPAGQTSTPAFAFEELTFVPVEEPPLMDASRLIKLSERLLQTGTLSTGASYEVKIFKRLSVPDDHTVQLHVLKSAVTAAEQVESLALLVEIIGALPFAKETGFRTGHLRTGFSASFPEWRASVTAPGLDEQVASLKS